MTQHKVPAHLLSSPSLTSCRSSGVLTNCRCWLVNMATAGATGDDLKKELTCAICLDFFKDPVILKCGHNFCRFCICMHWDENGGDYGYQCPQCRTVSWCTLTAFFPLVFCCLFVFFTDIEDIVFLRRKLRTNSFNIRKLFFRKTWSFKRTLTIIWFC